MNCNYKLFVMEGERTKRLRALAVQCQGPNLDLSVHMKPGRVSFMPVT